MSAVAFVIVVLVVVVAALLIAAAVRIVPEYQRLVVLRLGRLRSFDVVPSERTASGGG